MECSRPFDPRDFRQALGMFATGVTIVTARMDDGTPVGVTANSFNSVSLEPPLVLWSLARNARSLAAFRGAGQWNVHILSREQEALSNRFARAGEDKFSGLELEAAVTSAPLLSGCSARFQCRTQFEYEGGDHVIFVGEVLDYDRSERTPLLYVTGGYALATRAAGPVATEPQSQPASALFSEDLLGYLLGRAHYQFLTAVRPMLDRHGLAEADFFVLALLSVREPLGADGIAAHTAYTGIDLGPVALQALCARGLLQERDQAFSLSERGRDAILHVLAAAKAAEADIAARLDPVEAAALRNLLKRLIAVSDPGLPKLWTA
ncbi:flavin reductase [Caldimonas tepidiphila]|uniref:flavin reductase n=1 Tax=Caldimonas tepidiphila TaxID=2315841 RepID=UPI000E5A71FC|nr:flavin reductase [Caldimonas tepidiphila]